MGENDELGYKTLNFDNLSVEVNDDENAVEKGEQEAVLHNWMKGWGEFG